MSSFDRYARRKTRASQYAKKMKAKEAAQVNPNLNSKQWPEAKKAPEPKQDTLFDMPNDPPNYYLNH